MPKHYLAAAAIATLTIMFGSPADAETIAISDGLVTSYIGDLGGFTFTGADFSAEGATPAGLANFLVAGDHGVLRRKRRVVERRRRIHDGRQHDRPQPSAD